MERTGRARLGWILPPFCLSVYGLTAESCGVFRFGLWCGHLRAKVLFSGHSVHHHTLVVAKLVLRKSFQRVHGGVFIAGNVCTQKIRSSEIMVVAVQAVGNAAKSAKRFESFDNPRFKHISRALEFFFRWPIRAERFQFRVDSLLQIFGLHAGTCRGLHLKLGAQHQRLLIRGDVKRNLFFINQLLVEAARFSASQDGCCEIRLGITGLENRRREPCFMDPRELHVVLNHGAALGGDWRSLRGDSWRVFAALERAEILFYKFFGVFGLEVSDDREACIVRSIVELEKVPDIFELCGLNVLVGTDDIVIVRMSFRKELVEQSLLHISVGLIFHKLTATIGKRWSSERMTTSPFCSLYFSNLSCGTSSGAGLGAALCACGLATDFVELCDAGCEVAGFCPAEPAAKIKNAPAASNNTRLSDAFIKVSFQI